MAKYRSSLNFATQYAAAKNGYASGIENYFFVANETTAGTFVAPALGTQGVSTSGSTPSVDISAGTDTSIKISVDGGVAVTASVVVAGLTSGVLIAEAFETAINTALGAAGQDGRVWMDYSSSLYHVYSQKLGVASAVVITSATSNDVADALKLGVANSGTEAVGTHTNSFLLFKSGSVKLTQPIELSAHRSGRQGSSIIKKKKVVEGEIATYACVDATTLDVDAPVSSLLECIFGTKTVSGSEISFTMADLPTRYLSILNCSNAHNAALNGGFAKSWTLTAAGDSPAEIKIPLKGRDLKYCGIAKASAPVSNSASFVCVAGEAASVEAQSVCMVVDADGRTVVAGGDGSLRVVSVLSDTVTLSAPVTCLTGAYLVPFNPYLLGSISGNENILTDLEGSVSFDGGSTTIEEITSVEIAVDPKYTEFDNYYGADGNRGYIAADRAEIKVMVEMNLSASQFKKIIAMKSFTEFSMKVVLGGAAARRMEIVCPRVIYNLPAIEIPENGVVSVKFEGLALQTAPGSLDAIKLSYK